MLLAMPPSAASDLFYRLWLARSLQYSSFIAVQPCSHCLTLAVIFAPLYYIML